MGEAKRRGSFEVRKQEGIQNLIKQAELMRLVRLENEANMTDEDRKKRDDARQLIAMISGLGSTLT